MELELEKIKLNDVKKYNIFCGEVKVGEYVAFWVSHNKKNSLAIGIRSSKSLQDCKDHAYDTLFDNLYITDEKKEFFKQNGDFEYKIII